MALDTTIGGPNADSYVTLAEWQAYATAMGVTLTTGTDAELESQLRRAANYLTRSYEAFWRGYRTNEDQALSWPRRARPANVDFRSVQGFNGILDNDGFEVPIDVIPAKVKKAQFEAAFLVNAGIDLMPTLERGGAVVQLTEKVDVISTSTTWANGANPRSRFTEIEGLLDAYVEGNPGGSISSPRVIRG